MKRYLLFLRKVRQTLLEGSSYSTVRACVASLVFVILAISCGPPPQGQYYVPEVAVKAAEKNVTPRSAQSQGSLPDNALVRLQRMPYLRNAFKESPRGVHSRSGLDDFYARTRGTVQHASIITGGSLDILKAFIAKGWAPIVMIQLPGRNSQILPVSRYNDKSSEIFLQNPTNLAEQRLSYEEFEKYWGMSSRGKFLLITPQALSDIDVQNVLGRYLPTEAFQQINVRSR
jgi:hypothetical protein